jgi:predicted transcriptional regulator of viral defense system
MTPAFGHSWRMDADAQREWFRRADEQHGVVAKRQVDDVGIGRGSLDHRLRSGQWRRLHRGVYAAFTGELTREARLWAAVLRAGQGAVLSHETAAELQHLTDRPSSAIHVTVPASRRPAQNKPIPGVVIHRSRHIRPQDLPQWELPRTRIEDTVLDLVGAAATFQDAYDWISRAVSGQYTTAGLLRDAAGERKRMRWRKWLDGALTDIAEGAVVRDHESFTE